MTDYYSDLTGAAPKAAAGPPPKPVGGPDWYAELTGGPQELTQGTGAKPQPIGDDLATGASPAAAAKASLAPDVSGQIKLLAQSMKIPENRFGVVDGNIVYADAKGNLQRAIPSVFKGGVMESVARAAPFIASEVGPSLPGIAGGVVGTLMGPTGMSIPASMGASAVTDVVRQTLANKMIGDEGRGVDWANVAGQGAMSGVGQAGGRAVSKMATQNPMMVDQYDRIRALSPAQQQQTAAVEAEARRRGVNLTAGQATDLPSVIAQERQLGRYPETRDLMFKTAQTQRGEEVPAAIRAELGNISPLRGEAAIDAFRAGGESIIGAREAARAKAADALYTEAFKANQAVDSPAINRLLDTPAGKEALKRAVVKMQNQMSLVGKPDEELTAAMREAAELGKMDKVPLGVSKGLKLRTLDYVKRAFGDMESEAINAGRKDDVRIFGDLRRGLTKELDAADVTARAGPNSLKPEGGAYRRARREYAEGSDAIENLLKGSLGDLNDLDGPSRQNMVNRIFNVTNYKPEEIARARQHFLLAGKIDDWNAGLASFLGDKFRVAVKESAQGAVAGNVPGKFRATVWGDPEQREIVKQALGDPTRIASFEKLMEVLQAASRSLPEGSPTATDMGADAARKTVGAGLRLLGKATSPQTYLNLGNEVVQIVEEMRKPENNIRLAKALLSGDYAKQLSQLRMLPPTGERALALTSQILARAGVTGTGAALGLGGPSDFEPPALDATQ